jgi:hypothetical protein
VVQIIQNTVLGAFSSFSSFFGHGKNKKKGPPKKKTVQNAFYELMALSLGQNLPEYGHFAT